MARRISPDNSGSLFDGIKLKKKFLRDCQLAEYLDEHNSVISEIRTGKREINDNLLLRICEKTGMSVKTARAKIAEKAE